MKRLATRIEDLDGICPSCGGAAMCELLEWGWEEMADRWTCLACGHNESVDGTQCGLDRALCERWKARWKKERKHSSRRIDEPATTVVHSS
jgi:hypothetical protein